MEGKVKIIVSAMKEERLCLIIEVGFPPELTG